MMIGFRSNLKTIEWSIIVLIALSCYSIKHVTFHIQKQPTNNWRLYPHFFPSCYWGVEIRNEQIWKKVGGRAFAKPYYFTPTFFHRVIVFWRNKKRSKRWGKSCEFDFQAKQENSKIRVSHHFSMLFRTVFDLPLLFSRVCIWF